ncbi:MAG: ABC transporter ATP-binding protein [Mesorhizobium sp.]
MIGVSIDQVTRRFGETTAIDAVSLDLAPGSFTALLGPSGCGKSTLLRLIAGFERPDAGRILFDGRAIADPQSQTPPEKRNVGVVFQSYALWPHMDVGGNVGYPLRTRGVPRAEMPARIESALTTVGLSGFASRPVDELSGGQRQRVALARCLIADTPVILFDEPLANLDMHLRASMIETFRDVGRRTGATIVYVTHDQAEALALADNIAVMDRGRVQQFGPPSQVYASPANSIVAGFVGRGSILSAVLEPDGAGAIIGGKRIPARGQTRGGAGHVLLRPEALKLADEGIAATVVATTYRGPVHEVQLRVSHSDELVTLDVRQALTPGESVHISADDAWIIPD